MCGANTQKATGISSYETKAAGNVVEQNSEQQDSTVPGYRVTGPATCTRRPT